MEERGRFLLEYIELLQNERLGEAEGFRHVAPGEHARADRPGARSRPVGDQQAARAQLLVHEGDRERLAPARPMNAAESIPQLRAIIEDFFLAPVLAVAHLGSYATQRRAVKALTAEARRTQSASWRKSNPKDVAAFAPLAVRSFDSGSPRYGA